MVAALTISVDSSIGEGFASAAGLIATSNATDIQGFIGLASLLNAEGFRCVGFPTRQLVNLMPCSWNLEKKGEIGQIR